MALNIRSEAVNHLADRLAAKRGVSKTEAVRRALEAALAADSPDLYARLAPLRARINRAADTGLAADKAFYDELSGDN